MRKLDSDFLDLFSEGGRKASDKKILKNVEVSPEKKRVISYDFERASGGDRIEPIIENGETIGVRYFCRCGNVAEIYFEFQK